MLNPELEKIEDDLRSTIIDVYAPKSTRWNKNHTSRAEWYFIWKEKAKTDNINVIEMKATKEIMENLITKQWYANILEKLKIVS